MSSDLIAIQQLASTSRLLHTGIWSSRCGILADRRVSGRWSLQIVSVLRGCSFCLSWLRITRNTTMVCQILVNWCRILHFSLHIQESSNLVASQQAALRSCFLYFSIIHVSGLKVNLISLLCVLFHLKISSLTDPTGGAITQIPMRSSTSSTAATVTEWASPSLNWWPCWRWGSLFIQSILKTHFQCKLKAPILCKIQFNRVL